MVLYVILEGILVNTISGQDIPKGISDMRLNQGAFDWITQQDWTDIVILSNQTWLYSAPGVRCGERFRAKIEYVSECLREALEKQEKYPTVSYKYSMKKPWCSGITDIDILSELWKEKPGLTDLPSTWLCRNIPFDVNYARSRGITNIITR